MVSFSQQESVRRNGTRHRVLSFASTMKVRTALHINDYTEEEIEASFYSFDDVTAFKQDVKQTLEKMRRERRGSSTVEEDGITFCRRGVECYSQDATKLRRKLRRSALYAVFAAQEAEYSRKNVSTEGVYGDERIAAAYAPYTRASVAAAYIEGLTDENVVKTLQKSAKKDLNQSERCKEVSDCLYETELLSELVRTCWNHHRLSKKKKKKTRQARRQLNVCPSAA